MKTLRTATSLAVTTTCTLLLSSLFLSNAEANVWTSSSNNGSVWWGTSSNWAQPAPNNTTNTAQNNAYFYLGSYTDGSGGTVTAATDNVTVTGADRKGYRIVVGAGKTVNFTLASNLILNPGATSLFGSTVLPGNTGTGNSSTTFFVRSDSSGLAVNMGQFVVGDATTGSHSLTFSGPLQVTDGSNLFSVVGSKGSQSHLIIEDGAKVTRYGLSVAAQGSYAGNTVHLSGVGSALQVTHRLEVGSNAVSAGSTPQETYDRAARQNEFHLSDGATSQVGALSVGEAKYAHSNAVIVEGDGSKLEISGTLDVGSGDSLGGNRLQLLNGSTVIVEGATVIAGHDDNGGVNAQANRISVGSGGTLSLGGDMTIHGLLQLAENGTLNAAAAARDVSVRAGGRFEAEGSGLGTGITTKVSAGGVFALGLFEEGGRTAKSQITLDSTVHFDDGTLELMAFAPSEIDEILLADNGALTGEIKLVITSGYEIQDGDEWTLLAGNTMGIDATFDFSLLDFAVDTSNFNQEGGWKLKAIPEPSTYAMLCAALSLSALAMKRRGS